jgi:hypothetical protein
VYSLQFTEQHDGDEVVQHGCGDDELPRRCVNVARPVQHFCRDARRLASAARSENSMIGSISGSEINDTRSYISIKINIKKAFAQTWAATVATRSCHPHTTTMHKRGQQL